MNACHQRCRIGYGFRHGQLQLFKLAGRIVEVQLIEHRVLPIAGQCRPILLSERTTLGKEPAQVGTLGQLVAVHRLVDAIATDFVITFAHRYHVDTLPRLQRDVPIVLRHARHHIVVSKRPTRTHETVLNPDVVILIGKLVVGNGVLRKNAGMGLAVVVHDVALVVDDVLNSYRRGNHLARSAEMIELATRQRNDRHAELLQFRIVNGGVRTQRTAKF